MWAPIVNFLIGIWLMASPFVLSYGDPARMNDRITGPLAGSFAFIAIWEITRPLRWCNILSGLWLLLAPWVLSSYPPRATINSISCGAVLIGLSFVKGKVQGRYGGGWSSLWKSSSESTPEDS